MRKTAAILALLIMIALVVLFRGKPGGWELPGVVDLTPSSSAAGPVPSKSAPNLPASETPADASALFEQILLSPEARLVRGSGEQSAVNAHAQFASSTESKALLAAAAKVAVRTSDCIREGSCDEGPRDDSAYFDPEQTAAKRLLAQALRLILEGADRGAFPDGLPIGQEQLFGVLKTGNEESRLTALELLMTDLSPETLDRILTERDQFQGDSGRLFYSILRDETASDELLRSHFMDALSDTLSHGDSETVLELVRHADELGLNEQEYAQSVSQLCRFTGSQFPKANWRAIRYHLEELRNARGFQLGPQSICKA